MHRVHIEDKQGLIQNIVGTPKHENEQYQRNHGANLHFYVSFKIFPKSLERIYWCVGFPVQMINGPMKLEWNRNGNTFVLSSEALVILFNTMFLDPSQPSYQLMILCHYLVLYLMPRNFTHIPVLSPVSY